VIGFLGTDSLDLYAIRLHAFHQGLRETGFVEGRSLALEYRWAEGEYGRFPTLLADFVSRKVAVIAAATTPWIRCAELAESQSVAVAQRRERRRQTKQPIGDES
jgi:putative ABC transport system substrate-binding protein